MFNENQILEGNKAIAKLMGYWENNEYGVVVMVHETKANTLPSELKYHTDWNELIPVVEKIFFMPFNENQGWEIEGLPFLENDILRVWKSVAKFCVNYDAGR